MHLILHLEPHAISLKSPARSRHISDHTVKEDREHHQREGTLKKKKRSKTTSSKENGPTLSTREYKTKMCNLSNWTFSMLSQLGTTYVKKKEGHLKVYLTTITRFCSYVK